MSFQEYLFNDDGSLSNYGISRFLLATVIGVLVATWLFANFFHKPEQHSPHVTDPSLPKPSLVTALWIYPVESCRGLQLQSAYLRPTGLDFDRQWMFVDQANDQVLTAHQDPILTRIHTQLSHDQTELTISIEGTDASVTIRTRPENDWLQVHCSLRSRVWHYPYDINVIFAKHFKTPVHLVYRPQSDNQALVQITSEASLADLNTRPATTRPLTMESLRPNIVIKGEKWQEDSWNRIQIVTNIPKDEERWVLPLHVAARRAHSDAQHTDEVTIPPTTPFCGVLCVPERPGKLHVGAELQVLEVTNKRTQSAAKITSI